MSYMHQQYVSPKNFSPSKKRRPDKCRPGGQDDLELRFLMEMATATELIVRYTRTQITA